MKSSKKIYVASKVSRQAMWRQLRADGWNIISTWIDLEVVEDFSALWVACINDVRECDVLIYYLEPGEMPKGALVEVGAALTSGKPVLVVGKAIGTWDSHPLVTLCGSLDAAFAHLSK